MMRIENSQIHTAALFDLIKVLDANAVSLPKAVQQKYSDIHVVNLLLDSRKVKKNTAFFAVAGERVDGRDYINEAIVNGACAVFVDSFIDSNTVSDLSIEERNGAVIIAVHKLTEKMSAIAGCFYKRPSQDMHLTGVTGTNGKTTCAYLLAQLMSELGTKTGLLGTLGCCALPIKHINIHNNESENAAEFEATGFTTPDALASQRYLAKLAHLGCQKVVMEVSSHALVQHRVAALSFDTAIFTNLSRDHLDFHESMDAYGKAKRQLFEFSSLSSAVINIDDAYGQQLAASLPKINQVIRYSIANTSADIYAKNIQYSMQGIEADIVVFHHEARLSTQLIGDFNLSNALAVIAAASLQGVSLEKAVAAFKNIQTATGRMKSVLLDDLEQAEHLDVSVIVDFAHTPDALKVALLALRKHSSGALICVFGCGGNRDVGKRALMGAVAEQLADKVYLTSDNPRDEQPDDIVRDILEGMKNTAAATVELDRAKAISAAIGEARSGSIVLVAGKGHEDYQLINGQRYAFNDYDVAKHELAQRCAA